MNNSIIAEQFFEYVPQILWGIAGLCLCLFLIYVLILIRASSLERLDHFRSKNYGFADLLNYAAVVDNGVVACKNGSLMAAWRYEGPDIECVTLDIRNTLSQKLNRFFASFDTGWMIHVDAVRKPVPSYFNRYDSHFEDPVSAAIDEERRAYFLGKDTMYDSIFIITFTYLPPKLSQQKLKEFMFTKATSKSSPFERTRTLISEFQKKCTGIDGSLHMIFDDQQSGGSKVSRLGTACIEQADGSAPYFDDFLAYLHYCVTGKSHLIYVPQCPIYLDLLLCSETFKTGITPKIGKKYIKTIVINSLPATVSSGILTVLGEMGCEYRWSSRFIFLDQFQAEKDLAAYRRKWAQKERGFLAQLFNLQTSKINLDAVEMVDEADQAKADNSSRFTAFGYYTSTIVILDEDLQRLEKNTLYFIKEIERRGFACQIEDLGTMDAWLGSFPGHGYENVIRPLISTLNFADIIPVSSPWIGKSQNPCPFYPENSPALLQGITGASLNTPFRLNLHEGDLGHTLVLGPTGSGKSTLLATLAIQARRYKGVSIFSFDKGMSMYAVCQAVGGLHFSPGADDSNLCFCPLYYLDSTADLAWASNWMQTLLILNGVKPDSDIVNAINNALKLMAERKKQDLKDGASLSMSLSTFVTFVQGNKAAIIRSALTTYLADGPMGQLLDATEDGLTGFSSFNVFEIEDLWNLDEKYRLPVLLYLFRRIEKSLRGQPAFIFLDEAWTLLGHEVFRDKIREWLKVLRKANCAVILATQSLEDAAESGILGVLIDSTKTKIFLPNPNATQERNVELYKSFGLNLAQIRIIASGTPKRDYFLKGSAQSRMFQLALGKFALAFVAVSSKDDIAMIKKLIANLGSGWVDEWLRFKGVEWPENFD